MPVQRTALLVKPDGVKRGLTGQIIARVEKRGLKITSLKMIWATENQADSHYPKDEKWINRLGEKTMKNYKKYGIDANEELGTDDTFEIGKMVRGWLIKYLTEGPMVKMIVEGNNAIDIIRKISGDTMPSNADAGTIRGDFSIDDASIANKEKRAIRNILHASETPEEAENEIEFWFAAENVYSYNRTDENL